MSTGAANQAGTLQPEYFKVTLRKPRRFGVGQT